MNREDIYIEKYERAPKRIQNLMEYENSIDTLRYLWKTYSIEDHEQCQKLSFEIGCVLLGLTHPKDFIPQLVKEVGVTQEIARAIAKDVNEKIFAQVKDILIETYSLNKAPQKTVSAEQNLQPQKPQGYSTPPAMFEKKLQQSVLMSSGKNTSTQKPTGESTPPPVPKNDPYKELPE